MIENGEGPRFVDGFAVTAFGFGMGVGCEDVLRAGAACETSRSATPGGDACAPKRCLRLGSVDILSGKPSSKMATTGARKQLTPKTILVGENDFMVAQTLRVALAVDGHKVDIAEDGEQAMGMFARQKYDLVITDFKLAKIDGLELAENVKRLSPSTPVVLFMAKLEAVKFASGPISNVDAVLGKPFSIVELQAIFEQVFPG